MTEENNDKPVGSIKPFEEGSKKTSAEKTDKKPKEMVVESVNQEELSMLLSEPDGYADIVKKIKHQTINPSQKENTNSSSDIPEYDLNKQMLAAKRKISSAKRTGPGQKKTAPKVTPPKAEQKPILKKTAKTRPPQANPESDAIIRDIVARDIARLCRSKS